MTDKCKNHLDGLVKLRFADISPDGARAAYAEGFPFGIASDNLSQEEGDYLRASAADALKGKLMEKGEHILLCPVCKEVVPISDRNVEGSVSQGAGTITLESAAKCRRCGKNFSSLEIDELEQWT